MWSCGNCASTRSRRPTTAPMARNLWRSDACCGGMSLGAAIGGVDGGSDRSRSRWIITAGGVSVLSLGSGTKRLTSSYQCSPSRPPGAGPSGRCLGCHPAASSIEQSASQSWEFRGLPQIGGADVPDGRAGCHYGGVRHRSGSAVTSEHHGTGTAVRAGPGSGYGYRISSRSRIRCTRAGPEPWH